MQGLEPDAHPQPHFPRAMLMIEGSMVVMEVDWAVVAGEVMSTGR